MEEHQLYLSPEQQKQFSRCFPRLLHFILCEVDKMGLSHIMSWEPSGTQFKMHNEDLFITELAPHFFVKQSKIRSFYRQLNLWGFERVGIENMWRREYFSREFPEEIKLIKRSAQSSERKKQAKSRVLAATKVVTKTPISSISDAVTNKEVDEAKKILRAFSARLKELSADANRELLTSLLQQAESSDVSSNEIASDDKCKKHGSTTPFISSTASTASSSLACNITYDEQQEGQSIQKECKECDCDPPSTTVLDPPLKMTDSATLNDFDPYMAYLEEDDLDLSFMDDISLDFELEPTNWF